MNAQVRPRRSLVGWVLRFGLLYVLFLLTFILGSAPLARVIPSDRPSEPGLMGSGSGLLVIALVNVALIAALILTSRWRGWKLAIGLALAYYGAVTFLTQIETWYFLSSISVEPRVLPYLFAMGVPPAFVLVPLAVPILGRWGPAERSPAPLAAGMSAASWGWRLGLIAVVYLVLYWTAGYFIAWQNPELRAFYGEPGATAPFLAHTLATLREDPWLFPFQLLRGLLWALCALPVIYGSRLNAGWTALLVALLFGLPQNLAQIIANPLMPQASVRLSHMVETVLSNFLFGLIVVALLYHLRGQPDLESRDAPGVDAEIDSARSPA